MEETPLFQIRRITLKDHTDITLLLDGSGSMSIIKNDVIGGSNEFIESQQQAGANASFTLAVFRTGNVLESNNTEYICTGLPIMDVAKLTPRSYLPSGGTPLLDAMGDAITRTGERLAAMPESDRPDKVVFVVFTDGEENSSHRFTKEQIREMVEHQQSAYNWQFVYLGANQDSFSEAGSIGFASAGISNFGLENTRAAYNTVSSNVALYRSKGTADSLSWTEEQRDLLVGN